MSKGRVPKLKKRESHTSTKVSTASKYNFHSKVASGLRNQLYNVFATKHALIHLNCFIHVDQLEASWPPAGLLLTSWQRGGEQWTYFGSHSRLPAGLHQAVNWPCVSPVYVVYGEARSIRRGLTWHWTSG